MLFPRLQKKRGRKPQLLPKKFLTLRLKNETLVSTFSFRKYLKKSINKNLISGAGKLKSSSSIENNQSINLSRKASRKKTKKVEVDSLISEDESPNETPRRERSSSRLGSSLISEDESPPRNRLLNRSSLPQVNTTPKSSPISVPLTPHRSTKTPRRSPDNLGSPKTHSDTPLRYSKTPRKLEIADSPTSSDDSKSDKKNERESGLKSHSSPSKPKIPSPKQSPRRVVAKKSTKRTAKNSKKTPSPKKPKAESPPSRMNQTVSGVSKVSIFFKLIS